MSEGEANMIMLSKVKELIQNIEAPIGKQTSNTWLLTSWLKCHKFLSLLYIDFFVTGTGTLCFLAYSIASSLPVISHSLQGATTFNSGFRAKNVSSKRTWSNKYTSEIHIKDCVWRNRRVYNTKAWLRCMPDHFLSLCIHEKQHLPQPLWQHPPWPVIINTLPQKVRKNSRKWSQHKRKMQLKLKILQKNKRIITLKSKKVK